MYHPPLGKSEALVRSLIRPGWGKYKFKRWHALPPGLIFLLFIVFFFAVGCTAVIALFPMSFISPNVKTVLFGSGGALIFLVLVVWAANRSGFYITADKRFIRTTGFSLKRRVDVRVADVADVGMDDINGTYSLTITLVDGRKAELTRLRKPAEIEKLRDELRRMIGMD